MLRRGKILWFNPIKGYGELKCSSAEKFFFTTKDLPNIHSPENLERGRKVVFALSDEICFGLVRVSTISFDEDSNNRMVKKDETSL